MSEWTPETEDRLAELWAEGHSGAEIGRRMSISKNAVIGKAHRLGLPPRPSPIKDTEGRSRTYAAKQASARQGRLEGSAGLQVAKRRQGNGELLGPTLSVARRPPPRPVYVGASRACCWPNGDPKAADFFFCGEPSVNGRSYCPTHLRVAYPGLRSEATAGSHDDVSSQNSRGASDGAPLFLADPSDQATPPDAPHTANNVRDA